MHKVPSYSLVAEVVVQRAGKWRRSGRETLVSHEVGRASATVCSLRRQGVEKREKAHCTSAAQPNEGETQVGLGINSVRHKEQNHSIDL